jgi:hypothetical protein
VCRAQNGCVRGGNGLGNSAIRRWADAGPSAAGIGEVLRPGPWKQLPTSGGCRFARAHRGAKTTPSESVQLEIWPVQFRGYGKSCLRFWYFFVPVSRKELVIIYKFKQCGGLLVHQNELLPCAVFEESRRHLVCSQ